MGKIGLFSEHFTTRELRSLQKLATDAGDIDLACKVWRAVNTMPGDNKFYFTVTQVDPQVPDDQWWQDFYEDIDRQEYFQEVAADVL